MHSAITFIEVGRGLGATRYPVVKLGLIGKTGKTWHILDPNSPICGARGHVVVTLDENSCHTVRIKGRPVCARCRSLLGPIPETEYIRSMKGAV